MRCCQLEEKKPCSFFLLSLAFSVASPAKRSVKYATDLSLFLSFLILISICCCFPIPSPQPQPLLLINGQTWSSDAVAIADLLPVCSSFANYWRTLSSHYILSPFSIFPTSVCTLFSLLLTYLSTAS